MDCTWRQYRDPISPRFCKPCSDLCSVARGPLEKCKEQCAEYLQRIATTTTEVVRTTTTEVVRTAAAKVVQTTPADSPENPSPLGPVSVSLIVFLLVLSLGVVIVFAFRKWKSTRRNNRRQGIEDEEKGDAAETESVSRGPVCEESVGPSFSTL